MGRSSQVLVSRVSAPLSVNDDTYVIIDMVDGQCYVMLGTEETAIDAYKMNGMNNPTPRVFKVDPVGNLIRARLVTKVALETEVIA